jgi:hypothetical protein
MLRGARGELIRQPWFQSIRRENADTFVFVTFGVALVITLALQFGISSITMTTVVFAILVRYPMWIAVGFFYIALGTKLAHHFLLWGNLLGGRPDWTVRRLGISSGHRSGGENLEQLLGVQVAPMGMLIFWLVFNVAMAALFGYVGVMVYRGMKRLGSW